MKLCTEPEEAAGGKSSPKNTKITVTKGRMRQLVMRQQRQRGKFYLLEVPMFVDYRKVITSMNQF